MKIRNIFAPFLFAVEFDDKTDSYNEIMEKWDDPEYIYEFYEENASFIENNSYINCSDKFEFYERIQKEKEYFENRINQCLKDENFEPIFKPLDNNEYLITFLQKEKSKQSFLRLYAIRIDLNCYLVTGGAIKLTLRIEDHPDSANEKRKLEIYKQILQDEGVFDEDSFFEFKEE